MTEEQKKTVVREIIASVAERLDDDMAEHFSRVYNWNDGYSDTVEDTVKLTCKDQLDDATYAELMKEDDADENMEDIMDMVKQGLEISYPSVEVAK